ncbi:MAG: MFS transporter [Planctomycetes bacterium]|nr:MFS transporter [Planctomycetota bacterium]
MAESPPTAAPPAGVHAAWRTSAWVLYDLANTVYAATLTFVFVPFLKTELGGLAAQGAVNFASMALAGLLVPLLGALADHTARTHRYLALATSACIAAMAGWSFGGGPWLLGCFFVANLAYNTSLLFYNALLPAVAPAGRAGRISGLGVGFGYLGTIVVLAVLLPLAIGDRTRFLVAAALFLGLALPCLVLVRDRRRPHAGSARGSLRAALASLATALRGLPRHRPLLWFLLGNFCLVDVLNTAVLFFADFTTAVFQDALDAGTLHLLGATVQGRTGLLMVMGLCLNGLALAFGIGLGGWTDRAPLRVLRASALALLGALVGGAVFGGTSALGYLLTLVGLGAMGLAGIQTAGRKVVVVLAPPAQTGQYFGLYGITTKLSVVGALVYGLVADAFGSRPAMLVQAVPLLLGLGCLAMVRLPAPDAPTEPR